MTYFAYGTNMNREQMSNRCPFSKVLSKAKLEGYKLIFNSRGVATIIHDEDSKVYGVLYEINEKCLDKLKEFEGYPRFYKMDNVKVIDKDNNQVEVLVFIATDLTKGQAREEHLNKILQGAQENNLPFEYIQNLKKRYGPIPH